MQMKFFLNPIIIGEILADFIMGKRERKNRAVLQEFFSSPRIKIVAIDEETSERYGMSELPLTALCHMLVQTPNGNISRSMRHLNRDTIAATDAMGILEGATSPFPTALTAYP